MKKYKMFGISHLIEKKKVISILVLGLISGLFSFLFLAFINYMIGTILENGGEFDRSNLILFILLLLGFIWSTRGLSTLTIQYSQKIFWDLRTEVLQIILKANYYQLDSRRDKIHSTLISDVGVLTRISLSIIQFISSIVIVVACLIYMGFQSFTLCMITLGTALAGMAVYRFNAAINRKRLTKVRSLENDFMKHFMAIMSGFKEIHMDPNKGSAIYKRKIETIAESSFGTGVEAYTALLNNQITGRVFFYILIGYVLLFHSVLADTSVSDTLGFVFLILYLLGALNTIIVLIPGIIQASIAARRLKELKTELGNTSFTNEIGSENIGRDDFMKIEISELTFEYEKTNSENIFEIGPIDFSIQKGDLIFIYGGNGSGKTTFINVLLGILNKTCGEIEFNDKKLIQSNYNEFRSLFAVVFSDFYLFDEFYGINNLNTVKATKYLEIFELDNKVTVDENGFSSVDLSWGQKKRLALISSLLEEKPILVLDEWAADQDPYFRRKFYKVIIPMLIEEGVTIIAITHDDAYYDCANKLFKMEFGKIIDQTELIEKELT